MKSKASFGTLCKDVDKILRELCNQMDVELLEVHAIPDHMYLCLSILPKYGMAHAEGRLKGKATIRVYR
jgi:putative transposase